MTVESSTAGQTVVVPGSADDPFSVNYRGGEGAAAGLTADRTGVVSQPTVTAPEPQRGVEPAPVVTPPATPAPVGMTEEQLNTRLREAQAGWDRRINLLQGELQQERTARENEARQHTQALRQAQLEQVRPEERAHLEQTWNFEDRAAALDKKQAALEDYHKSVEGLRLLQLYAPFGVTEDELMALSDVDKMESYAKDKKLAFFENGGKVAEAGSGGKPDKPAGKTGVAVPAGADAHYDSGGQVPAPDAQGLLTGAGVDTMGTNIKNLFAQANR